MKEKEGDGERRDIKARKRAQVAMRKKKEGTRKRLLFVSLWRCDALALREKKQEMYSRTSRRTNGVRML